MRIMDFPEPASSGQAVEAAYHGQRIVVTGGAGFIGHHLVRRLLSDGASVLVLDDLSTGLRDRLDPEASLEQLDLSRDDPESILRAWRPSIVFHLAAQASVPRGEADPGRDLGINGAGTLRLVLAAERTSVSRIVFTSSGGAVYGECTEAATEESAVRPASYYGIHKLLGEMYLARSSIACAISRPSNVYGPGQDGTGEGAVVAAFTDAARTMRGLTIHGDGRQERDFVHVADVVDGLVLLGAIPARGTWNIAAGTSIAIRDLATIVERAAGRSMAIEYGAVRAGDVRFSRLSSERIQALGWRPRRDLEAEVRAMITSSRVHESGHHRPEIDA